jgi:hypothetical protein
MNTEHRKSKEPLLGKEFDESEKLVFRRITAKFREWYAALSVKELTNNPELSREIAAFEGIFRAAMM